MARGCLSIKRSDQSRRLYLPLSICFGTETKWAIQSTLGVARRSPDLDEPDLDDDEDDWENDSPINDDYNAEVTEEEAKAEVTDGVEAEHGVVVREATKNDTVVDAFNTTFAGLSEKVKNTHRQPFLPVLTTMSLMLLFATAIANDRTLFLADVTGTFLLPPLLPEEVVYARPPKGYENHPEFKGKILRLVKSSYGLRQAPRRWYDYMRKILLGHGLKNLACEKYMFTLNLPNGLAVKA